MKQLIIILLSLSIFLSVLTGCQEVETTTKTVWTPSTPLLVDYSDSVFELSYDKEYNMMDTDPLFFPDEKMTITFDGNSYTGEYQSTLDDPLLGSQLYRYTGYYNDRKFQFSVSSKDGNLCEFLWSNYQNLSQEKQVSQDNCRAIADTFLKNEGLDHYTLSKQDSRDLPEYYIFEYTRSIGSVNTIESIMIWISTNGEIFGYFSRVLTELDRPHELSNLIFKDITEKVYQKLDSILTNALKKHEKIEYQEPQYMLTVLKDGALALYCSVSVEAKTQIAENHWECGGEMFTFIIPLVSEKSTS